MADLASVQGTGGLGLKVDGAQLIPVSGFAVNATRLMPPNPL